MMSPPILVPEAKADVADAYLWYEDQCLGLGMEFLRCVEAALLSIQRSPLIYPKVHPKVHETYRRTLVRRFPFTIFFEFDDSENQCIVYSVFHCSHDPEKWRGRLPQ
ncbi:type II toxin-antitoxin system RelE/ParE family toxin [Desulfonatronum thioautotrophicum]|uniref:type II toxin-antitoxin system RelE/ParE family toxin n=1 Tax=Desulfonatronum thioautotrophicum TaxID=617001 RepID=UPI0005EBDE0E|nr:type II toxin-antitoxin system RelE/ParE family toxin [Desulfonatronum thioautotrophicum]